MPIKWLNRKTKIDDTEQIVTNVESIDFVILHLKDIRPMTYLHLCKINHYSDKCCKKIIEDIKIYYNNVNKIIKNDMIMT